MSIIDRERAIIADIKAKAETLSDEGRTELTAVMSEIKVNIWLVLFATFLVGVFVGAVIF